MPVTPRWAQLDAAISASSIVSNRLEATLDALGADQVMVGETQGLNPLGIRAPTEDALDGADGLDPLAAQSTRAMGFFASAADSPLGERS